MTTESPHLPGATCPQISTVQLCLRTVRREMGEALNLASCEALDRADAELDSLREANAALRVAAEGAGERAAPEQQDFVAYREVVELMAEVGEVADHDSNGPGYFRCQACGESEVMRWKSGAIINSEADIAHNAHCPMKWARQALAQAAAPPSLDAQNEREAFESWVLATRKDRRGFEEIGIADLCAMFPGHWEAWQARAALALQEADTSPSAQR